jgi:hypothetical protein
MKYYRLTPDFILWDISFANISMYVSSIPDYKKEEEKKEPEELIDGLDGLKDLEDMLYVTNIAVWTT